MAGTQGTGTNINEIIEYTDDATVVSPLDWNKLINLIKVVLLPKISTLELEVQTLKAKVSDLEAFHP